MNRLFSEFFKKFGGFLTRLFGIRKDGRGGGGGGTRVVGGGGRGLGSMDGGFMLKRRMTSWKSLVYF